jgi:hypothetical protein
LAPGGDTSSDGARVTNKRTRSITTFGALCNPAFHLGVTDKLAGMPLREDRPEGGDFLYEEGRLFVAFCQAIGEPVPTLPSRGQRQARFAALLALYKRAWADQVFPYTPQDVERDAESRRRRAARQVPELNEMLNDEYFIKVLGPDLDEFRKAYLQQLGLDPDEWTDPSSARDQESSHPAPRASPE